MSAESVARRGRAAAERNMTDSCIITRAGAGTGDFDEATGRYDTPDRVTVYEGPCRVQVTALIANASGSSAGERAAVVQSLELQLPVAGTGDVSVGDVAKVVASSLDSELVDREFTVTARHEKSQATARRLRVAEVTG